MIKHAHYHKNVKDLDSVDIYAVCELFEVEDASGATQHAIKKLLMAGRRGGGKAYMKDLREARDTIERKLALLGEEE